MSDHRPLLSRRHFLFSLGAGGVATATAVAGLGSAKEHPLDATTSNVHSTRGYRESAHITRYYRSTKI